MAVRPKTKRRLFILLTVLVLLAGAGGGAYAWRMNQIERRILRSRDQGMAAFAEENYIRATQKLGRYVNKYPNDAEALYHFAKAREQAEEVDGSHLAQAMQAYRRLLSLKPDHTAAKRRLLEIYPKIGHYAEAIDLASTLLETDPDDTAALRVKATALEQQAEYAEALALAERHNELEPLDVSVQIMTFRLLRSTGRPVTDLVDRALALNKAYPDDPRAALLVAIAHVQAKDLAQAGDWSRKAAQGEPPDATFVLQLTRLLASLGPHDLMLKVLLAGADKMGDRDIRDALIHRLWETNRYAEVVERLADLQPQRQASAELLALKAMSLLRLGRSDEAAPIIQELEDRKADPVPLAWMPVLTAVAPGSPRDDKHLIEACKKALTRLPNHPYLHFFLAEAYAGAGEQELALTSWAAALAPDRRVPFWTLPRLRMARTLMAMGQTSEALAQARIARTLAPNSIPVNIVLAETFAASLKPGQENLEKTRSGLLALVENIQKAVPGEPITAVIRVQLLADSGQTDAARQAIQAILAADQAPPQGTLLQLAETSRRAQLGVENDCLQRCAEVYGLTPDLAYAQAVMLAGDGQPENGRERLASARAAAAEPDSAGWRLVHARYLQSIADEGARDAWIALADDLPNNMAIQRLALQSISARTDPAFADRTIERLRKLTGEESLGWRLPRARWLLAADQGESAATAAIKLLQQVTAVAPSAVEAHLLLAECYRRLDNLSAAAEALTEALRYRPESRDTVLDLAYVLQAQGDYRSARGLLDRVRRQAGSATPAQSQRVAALLASAGALDEAIDLLESLNPDIQLGAEILLADLYRRSNELGRAEAIYRKFLENPSADVKEAAYVIEVAAGFFAFRQELDEAELVLGRLDELDLDPGIAELARANYYRRIGTAKDTAKAGEFYDAAAAAAPKEPAIWKSLIIHHLSVNKLADEALVAVNQALQNCPDDETLKFLQDKTPLIRSAWRDTSMRRRLLVALVQEQKPQHRLAVAEILEILKDTKETEPLGPDTVAQLRQVADRNLRLLPAQIVAIQAYLAQSRADEAAGVATRAMQSFPTAAEPAWLAAEALTAAGQLTDALSAAREWRERSASQALAADMMIADVQIKLGEAEQAVAQVESHLERALQDPDTAENFQIISAAIQTLIRSDQIDRAASLLAPLLERSAKWRYRWMQLAFLVLPDVESASTWLERVAKLVPDDAANEQAALALAWRALDERWGVPACSDRARQILAPLLEDPQVPAQAVLTLAKIDDSSGDRDAAEAGYRRVLTMGANESRGTAMNNLAMILLDRDGDLAEALDLASRAIQDRPRVAAFRDTLAAVHVRRGDFEEAEAAARMAVGLERGSLRWRLSLAQICLQAGKTDESARMLRNIDRQIPDPSGLSAPLRRSLADLRAAVDAKTPPEETN